MQRRDGRRVAGWGLWFLICAMAPSCGVDRGEGERAQLQATAALQDLVKDERTEGVVAALAVAALAEARGREAVPELIRALDHGQAPVVIRAVRALGEIGDERAVAPLQRTFQYAGESILRVEAASALARLGDAASHDALEAWIRGEPDTGLRAAATAAIGRLKDPRSIPVVRDAFREDVDSTVRSNAAAALAQLADRESVAALGDTLMHTRDQSLAMAVAQALEVLGGPEAVLLLEEAIRMESPALPYYVRRRCIEALGRLGSREVRPYLRELLKNGSMLAWRVLAAEGLGTLRDTSAVDLLRSTFRTERAIPLRMAVAIALGRLGRGAEVSGDVVDYLGHNNPSFRIRAAETLGEVGDARRVSALEGLLSDEQGDVQDAAARALGRIGGAVAARVLARAYRQADQPEAQAMVLSLLGGMPGPESRAALREFLNRADSPGVRAQALAALGRSGDRDQIGALRGYLGDPEPEVRFQAAAGILRVTGKLR